MRMQMVGINHNYTTAVETAGKFLRTDLLPMVGILEANNHMLELH